MNTTRRQQLIALGALALPLHSLAQRQSIPKIGYLTASSLEVNASRIKAFRQGLLDQDFIEGKHYTIEFREALGKLDRTPGLLAELIAMKVDVLVTAGPADTKAAHAATRTIPIVMGFDPDPVSNGYVASLSKPGGNITGVSTMGTALGGKQLSLLKQIIPKVDRVAVIGSAGEPGNAQTLRELDPPAKQLGIRLQILDVSKAADIELAFEQAVLGKAQAVLALQSPYLLSDQGRFIAQAEKHRLPALYVRSELVNSGGLISYGPDMNNLSYTAASYVVKILKGARPGDLPVQQPTKFELVLNQKTAKALKLNIPQSVLIQIDRVIE
jgi:putative ABC transport system substrate-binding protein